MSGEDESGPSSRPMMAPNIVGGAVGNAERGDDEYEPFWQAASNAAQPALSSIRRRLPHFSSPPLRIQRVSQLDAELLDTELTTMLLEPLKAALRNIRVTLPTTLEPELLLVLRLALYKFSIFDRGATYGAMLQNLRYRNEWAHRGGLQSTSRDAPLSRFQLLAFPSLTIVAPYLHTKLERTMSRMSYSDMPSDDVRRILWNGLDRAQRIYAALTLANFLAFLSDGRYRTLTDRVLGMRLTYAQRTMNRNVSFEFLNRQLVWHAFTESLLFLLPLVKPRRLLRRLLRLPTHPLVLSTLLAVLPSYVASRVGLSRDEAGKPRFRMPLAGSKGVKEKEEEERRQRARYATLPEGVCAICWERLEAQAGIKSQGTAALRAGIPSSDPLDPSSTSSSSSPSSSSSAAASAPNGAAKTAKTAAALTTSTSASGLAYADALIHTSYDAEPCSHAYCYVCIADKLLSEDAAEELADGDEANPAAWSCLRCGAGVRGAKRSLVDQEEETEAEGA
ncbi:hypothetical protein L7F22_007869 [Adiantum nelumboides]|nr:hypothetical protein [Adiantum nelumboides]